MIDLHNKTVILSKINQIGDVIFSLPAASILKKMYPSCKIVFLISYSKTKDLLSFATDVDEILDYEELNGMSDQDAARVISNLNADAVIHFLPNKRIAKLMHMAGVNIRVGTSARWYNLLYCNRFVYLRRSDSNLHESVLDMMLLKPFTGKKSYLKDEIEGVIRLKHESSNYLDPNKFNLIIHPKTRGEHIEWDLNNYANLIKSLPQDKFNIIVTGSLTEGEKIANDLLEPCKSIVTNLTGKTSLHDLIALISQADGLIAGSTGPVHIAAAYGINTLGLYAPIKPFDSSRWGPIGLKATSLSVDKDCSYCRDGRSCLCVNEITLQQVLAVINSWLD